jgi:hypothetical protein
MSNRARSRSGFQDHGNKTPSHSALSVFLTTSKRMLVHARASHLPIAENPIVEIAAPRRRALSRLLGFAGGHAKPAEIDASGRLLLPLLPREETGKLRQNVRAAEVRVALVGNVLREITKPLQRRQSRGRAAFAAQRSRRARPPLNSLKNQQLAYGLQIYRAQPR